MPWISHPEQIIYQSIARLLEPINKANPDLNTNRALQILYNTGDIQQAGQDFSDTILNHIQNIIQPKEVELSNLRRELKESRTKYDVLMKDIGNVRKEQEKSNLQIRDMSTEIARLNQIIQKQNEIIARQHIQLMELLGNSVNT